MTGDPIVSRLHVLAVLGTRPEAIKLFPLIRKLDETPGFGVTLVNTGQHRDLVKPVLDMAGRKADVDLNLGSHPLSLNALVPQVVTGLAEVIDGIRFGPSESDATTALATIVHGDTSTAMATALTSVQAQVPVIHVEAGLRSGDTQSPFPEELNRQIIARLACMHFAPTVMSMEHLVREGISADQVFVTGNTGIDALIWAADRPEEITDPRLRDFEDSRHGPLMIVTAHRRESWGTGMSGIAEGVRSVAARRPDVSIVVPMHPNPKVRESLEERLSGIPNVLLTEPLGYRLFAHLLRMASVVLTDSGGIQEEAPSLGTPVLVAREETERVEGIDAGTLQLVGTNPEVIAEATISLLANPPDRDRLIAGNPYGDGFASARIMAALEALAFDAAAPTPFGPGFSRSTVLRAAGYGPSHDREAPSKSVAFGAPTVPKFPHWRYAGPERRGINHEAKEVTEHVRYIGPERRSADHDPSG